MKRWWKEGVRPHFRHQMALLDLADDLGLGHLFTDWSIRRETGNGTPGSAGGERSAAMQEPKAKGGASAGLPRPQGLLTNKLIGPYDRSRGGRAESEALITG